MIHKIDAEVWLVRPIEEVFEFFSDAFNLEAKTPPRFGIRVVTPRPISLKAGALIDYKLKVNGIRWRWTT